MAKYKSLLLATTSGLAAATVGGGAQAADMPSKAPPAIAPVPYNWTGFYIGANVGAAWQQAHTQGTGYDAFPRSAVPINFSTTQTGFIGGGQIGYNWQNGNAVYGVEADISGLTGRASASQPYAVNKVCSVGSCVAGASSKIDWLATFRGRLGLAVNNTMVYATGGLAVGHVKNSFTTGSASYNSAATWTDNSTRLGFAIGGGVEHMLTPNWTVRLEGLFVDLGKTTANLSSAGTWPFTTTKTGGFKADFRNQLVIGRLGLNYKF